MQLRKLLLLPQPISRVTRDSKLRSHTLEKGELEGYSIIDVGLEDMK